MEREDGDVSDGPRVMPHPDDPPPDERKRKGGGGADGHDRFTHDNPWGVPAAQLEQVDIEVAAGEAEDPPNKPARFSAAIAALVGVLVAVQFFTGWIPLVVPFLLAAAAIGLGVWGIVVRRDARKDDAWLAVSGVVLGVLSLVSVGLDFFVSARLGG